MNQESTTEGGLAEALGLDQEFDALASKARQDIQAFVQDKPHAALGIAAIAGFVLGGGLTPRRLFKIAVAAGGPVLSRQLRAQLFATLQQAMESQGVQAAGEDADAGASADNKPKRARRARAATETS